MVLQSRRRPATGSLANTLRFEARNSSGGWKIKVLSEVITGRKFKVQGDQQALSSLSDWLATTIRTRIQTGHRQDKLTFQCAITNDQLATIKSGSAYKWNNVELTEVTVGAHPRQPTAAELLRQVERRAAKLKFDPTGDIMAFKQEFLEIFRNHEALGKLHLFVYLDRDLKLSFEVMRSRGESLQFMMNEFYEHYETRRIQNRSRLEQITFENCSSNIDFL